MRGDGVGLNTYIRRPPGQVALLLDEERITTQKNLPATLEEGRKNSAIRILYHWQEYTPVCVHVYATTWCLAAGNRAGRKYGKS